MSMNVVIGAVTRRIVLLFAFAASPAFALSDEAKEFMAITDALEPVQCEKRQLRREMVLAEYGHQHARLRELRKRFETLNADPKYAAMEKRLGDLEKRISNGKGGAPDPDDLDAISFQQRQMFYRCT